MPDSDLFIIPAHPYSDIIGYRMFIILFFFYQTIAYRLIIVNDFTKAIIIFCGFNKHLIENSG